MTRIQQVIGSALLAGSTCLCGQNLEQAEVRFPYQELKQLLARAESAGKPKAPEPALLSARLVLSLENGKPVLDASFRTASFDESVTLIPLVSGELTLDQQEPAEARILMRDGWLSLASDRAGTTEPRLLLRPVEDKDGFTLSLPPCPSSMLETRIDGDGQAFLITCGDRQEILAAGKRRPITDGGRELHIRLMDDSESREALRPPEPSEWSWQHQALVVPADGDLIYHLVARASAANGSGVEAVLPLPADARDITASGDDLLSHSAIRGANHAPVLSLRWKTRGILDRRITLSYRMPLRPLDRHWTLQAPGGGDAKTLFIITASPTLAYAAEGLSGPLSPQGLPASFASLLKGRPCHHLEAGTTAELKVSPIPVAATATGVVSQAEWNLKIEPDGAMLATGQMSVEHKDQIPFRFDTPEGMKLLSCDVGGKPHSPVDLGGGALQVTLPPAERGTLVCCSFTGSRDALDPVEGTLKLTLPQTPLFIHSLLWSLDLPPGYQAETHGNLRRTASPDKEHPARISLRKNLCRDERPEIHVFYQRQDLNR